MTQLQQPQQNSTELYTPTRPHTIAKYELLTPKIIDLVVEQGLNKSQIARKLNMDRETVSKIMRSIQFQDYASALLHEQLIEINELKGLGKYERVQALNERGRILRATIPVKIQTQTLIQAEININIRNQTEHRRTLVRELNDDDYKVWSDAATRLQPEPTPEQDPDQKPQDPDNQPPPE